MNNYQIVWRGPVLKKTGLGIASREYVLALDRQGIDVKVDAKITPTSNIDSRIIPFIKKPMATSNLKILIYHYPPYKIDITKEKNYFDHIMLNTVWETTKIPQKWFPNINHFDAICVPSSQNRAALINSGISVPIYLVPHGVDTHEFNPFNKKLTIENVEGKFIFVSIFSFQHRKNPETLLRAYWEEFSPTDNVLLVIKTNGYKPHETGDWIRNKILKFREKYHSSGYTAPIFLITDFQNHNQLKGIYTLGNVFVLPTRGEGVGLPFLESLASGVPVIATGWGGQMDFLHHGNSFLIDYTLQNPAISIKSKGRLARSFRHLFAEEGQLWAEPDINSLKKLMRFAYENIDLCKEKGEQGRKDMLQLSWDHAGTAMKQAIEQVIGDEHMREGLS